MITEYPLTKANRINLAKAFRNVPRVDISIDCVLEAQMGNAFVDNMESPSAFKIMVGPFFYFAGDATSEGGQAMLKDIRPYNLFMSSSAGWIEECRKLYGERLVAFDRYSFSSENLSLATLQQFCQNSVHDIKQMDLALLGKVWGRMIIGGRELRQLLLQIWSGGVWKIIWMPTGMRRILSLADWLKDWDIFQQGNIRLIT